jgi:hypothetical protein
MDRKSAAIVSSPQLLLLRERERRLDEDPPEDRELPEARRELLDPLPPPLPFPDERELLRLEALRLEPPLLEPPRLEPLRLEPPRLEPPLLEPLRPEPPLLEPLRLEPLRLEPPLLEPPDEVERPRERERVLRWPESSSSLALPPFDD